MVSVVIPSYNHWELTHSLLLDIYKNFPHDTEAVVVDDASPSADVGMGLEWWKNSLLAGRMKVYVNKSNYGFLKTANFGVSVANGDVIVLVSTDVKIRDRDLCTKIVSALSIDETPILVGTRLLGNDTGWNMLDGRIFPYLEGWLLGFRKSDWNNFGGFDPRYAPNDFEDVDISTTYIQNGGRLVEIQADVEHLGAQSIGYTPEREARTRINREKFREKWLTK